MKAFKRITALTLSLTMIIVSLFSMGSFAEDVSFTDVVEGNQYYDAIYSLVGKGVIEGYEDKTFKPDNTITRAEFATILARATTNGVSITATTNVFPDVAVDYWANPYINCALKTGAVNGYEDGTFRPENPVSYGEAVKMIVCTLGYKNVVQVTDPWYNGYIDIAVKIGLTKNAGGVGDADAKRGIVAQLIYNMANCKQLVQTGTDSSGKPTYSTSIDDYDYEEASGILTAVFEDSILGDSSLNKQQVMIDETVYNIGSLSIDKFLPYLGKKIDFEYSDGANKVIESFEEAGGNETVTVTDTMLENIDGREITYYKQDTDKKASTVTLSNDLKVVYNGYGVAASEIDDDFIQNYLNVGTGEITLINNNGKSDYDVAFVTSYETFYVTGVSSLDGEYKIYDTYGSVKEISLNENDCKVYKVSSVGGTKAEATLLSIAKNTVVSVAKPLDRKDNTEVIVSAIKLTNSSVTSKTNNTKLEIGSTVYDTSDYYEALIDADSSKYDVSVGDTASFYLDYKGRIVYVSKTESTDPYGYLMGIDTGSGLNSNYEVRIFSTSGTILSKYYLKDNVRINGSSYSSSEAVRILENNADAINSGKVSAVVQNATYAQLIKYKTTSSSGKTLISEISTIDADSAEAGDIVPGMFRTDATGDKMAYSDGASKLKYNNSGKAFRDAADNNQFIINASTIILNIPNDRTDEDSYKKVSYSYFSNDGSYVVEPYDITSNIAKVVLVYAGGASAAARVYSDTNCAFVESMSDVANKDKDKNVKKITFYNAGETKKTEMMTEEIDTITGIAPGDIVKFAKEDNEIVGFQTVFAGGKLYDWDPSDVFTTFESTNNYIVHNSSTKDDYYQVIHGTLLTNDIEDGAGAISVVPQIVTDAADFDKNTWKSFNISKSTQYYKWDSNKGVYTFDVPDALLAAEDSDPISATKVVVISMNNAVKAVYILQ